MAQLIDRMELALVLDETISPEKFEALYRTGIRVIRTAYRGDPEDADLDAREALAGILFGVCVRIASNPKGARQLNAGGAGLTFGGADADIASVFSLTDDERADLAALLPAAASRSGAFTIMPYGAR